MNNFILVTGYDRNYEGTPAQKFLINVDDISNIHALGDETEIEFRSQRYGIRTSAPLDRIKDVLEYLNGRELGVLWRSKNTSSDISEV